MSPAPRSRKPKNMRPPLLENCVEILAAEPYRFAIYEKNSDFQKAIKSGQATPARYVVKQFPHPTLYNTPGAKEALIHWEDGDAILECKWQQGSGSVDEKLPYVFEQFKASPFRIWLVVLEGPYWTESQRGRTAFNWIKGLALKHWVVEQDRARVDHRYQPRHMLVVTRPEFFKLVGEKWGRAAA